MAELAVTCIDVLSTKNCRMPGSMRGGSGKLSISGIWRPRLEEDRVEREEHAGIRDAFPSWGPKWWTQKRVKHYSLVHQI